MELMWLVYVVENLTYDGNFFGVWAVLVLVAAIVWLIARLMSQGAAPDTPARKHIAEEELKVGRKFVLKTPVDDLKAGKEYTITHYWRALGDIRVEDSGRDYKCAQIGEARVKVGEEFVIPAYINPIKKPAWKTLITMYCVFVLLDALLPTRQTAIYMAGAYMVQQVVTHEKTKALGDKTYDAAIKQLDKWAEEVPELKVIAEEVLEEKK